MEPRSSRAAATIRHWSRIVRFLKELE